METKIATMRTLKGHPNMLDLQELFEDDEGFHVVVEYLPGQALFDTISANVRRGVGWGRGWGGV